MSWKWLYRIDNLVCTGFIFLFIGVVYYFSLNISVFDPIEKALKDFSLTDIIFSDFKEEAAVDTNIVLVNIGNLPRKELAHQLRILNNNHPRVIGIDAFFRTEKDPFGDLLLEQEMARAENLVLVSKLVNPAQEGNCFGGLEFSHPRFSQHARSGFANFITGAGEGFRTTREFTPKQCVADSFEYSMSAQLVRIYNESAYSNLINRGNELETINFSGNYQQFTRLDVENFYDTLTDFSIVKDKIVIMGFMGTPLGEPSLVDIFFTPLNERPAGRTYPDMYGAVVHANIVSQILDKKYINAPPEWTSYALAFILCYLNVALFIFVARKMKVYYDLITKLLQLVEVLILFGITLSLFYFNNYKVDLTFPMIVILLTGDLTEVYYGSLRGIYFKIIERTKQYYQLNLSINKLFRT